jgi:hypothetical protein
MYSRCSRCTRCTRVSDVADVVDVVNVVNVVDVADAFRSLLCIRKVFLRKRGGKFLGQRPKKKQM